MHISAICLNLGKNRISFMIISLRIIHGYVAEYSKTPRANLLRGDLDGMGGEREYTNLDLVACTIFLLSGGIACSYSSKGVSAFIIFSL